MAIDLFLRPVEGALDVARIREFLMSRPDVFLDPIEGEAFLICGNAELMEHLREKRVQDPTRLPYACYAYVKPEMVSVIQEWGTDVKVASSREVLAWLLTNWACTIEDQVGTDLTERYRAGGLEALYAL